MKKNKKIRPLVKNNEFVAELHFGDDVAKIEYMVRLENIIRKLGGKLYIKEGNKYIKY